MIISRGRFKIDIYRITIYIYICSDSEDTTKQANKIIRKYKEEEYTHPSEGLVFCPDDDTSINYLFLSVEDLSVNTITHETDHIRNNIIDHCAIVESDDARETSANLSGYINEKVFKFLQKKDIKFIY